MDSVQIKLHIRYFRRCLSALPAALVEFEQSRTALICFCITALDLLGVLDDATISHTKQRTMAQWIIDHLYVDCGNGRAGFRPSASIAQSGQFDGPQLAATFFALCSLLTLHGNLSSIDTPRIRQTVISNVDPVTGVVFSFSDPVNRECDVRQSYFAIAILYLLRIVERIQRVQSGMTDTVEDLVHADYNDIDREANQSFEDQRLTLLVTSIIRHVDGCRTFDGAYAMYPNGESHAGITFCAVAAKSLAQRLLSEMLKTADTNETHKDERSQRLQEDGLLQYEHRDEQLEEQSEYVQKTEPIDFTCEKELLRLVHWLVRRQNADGGFNGRIGKDSDTCYVYWNVATLCILAAQDDVSKARLTEFLLNETQSKFGGFAKSKGGRPDPLHSMLGIATLALSNNANLKPIDPSLCISQDALSERHQLKPDSK